MAHSREQLTMDMNKSENSIFTRPSGCYISRTKGFLLFIVLIAAAAAVGLITYHLTSPCDNAFSKLTNGTSSNTSSGSGSNDIDSSDSHSGSSGHMKVRDVRLPRNVRPLYYKVDLIPFIEPERNFTLDGTVSIDILCLESTNKVTIHIKNITLDESKVRFSEKCNQPASGIGNCKGLTILKHEYDLDRDFYNLTLDETLEPNKKYNLHIEFTGHLSDELAGFYRSSYQDKATNETRWLAVTQFQPTDARRAFPCFDEPHLKAEFEVSLARRTNMTSISNMDLRKTEAVNLPGMEDWVWDHYQKSVPMSTYLVAFVVSDFQHLVSNETLSKPTFKVWARKSAIEQAEYARDIGPRILTYFETYFGIDFPLPKQDMIALPDFAAGAMENWGLITYRETAMLFDPKVSSDQSKQRVAVVISHELAHQWFGNLVTPAWWNGLWLNEGFASYVEYIGVDHVEPDLKILDQFVTDEVHDVFSLDALDSSHPISVEVDHPDEINEIFDSISYAKGASIIRMMNHFLTQSTFNKGLTNYLKKWKYNNTEQSNLWDALTDQGHQDKTLDIHMRVGDVMDTWTLQKGFPVINVERHYPQKSATFTQSKFSLIKNESFNEEYKKYSWWVPISYASQSFNQQYETRPQFWIPKTTKSYDHELFVNKTEWLIVNCQETGYYRVNYDVKNWKLLVDQLNKDPRAIHTVNRAQLLDDSLNLARAGLLSYDLAFNVTQFLRRDDEYIPWQAFLNNLQYIYSMFSRTSSFGIFKKHNRELISIQYDKVGINENPNDPTLTKYHRINIVGTACSIGHTGCVQNSQELFSSWMNSTDPDVENPIPMNLRRVIYCNGIRYGGESEWEFTWERYLNSNVASEKALILQALACSRETWILNRYLQWSITPGSGIRKQDSRIVLSSVANNDIGNFLAFNFMRDKWSTIRKYFGTGFSMGGFIKSITSKFNTEFELLELQNFKKAQEHNLGSATRALDQSIERVQANIEWMKINFQTITNWLESQL